MYHKSSFPPIFRAITRSIQMIQCIQYRRSTFLGNPEWLTLPWGKKGKDIYQQLYDKGFLLGALLEDIDNAELTKENENISVVSGFLGRLSSLDEDLNLWFGNLLQESPSPLYWHVESTSSSRHLIEYDQPRPPFAFRTLLSANTIVKYWGLRIILSNTIALTCQRVLSMTTQMPAYPSSSTSPQIFQDLHSMSLQLLKALRTSSAQCPTVSTKTWVSSAPKKASFRCESPSLYFNAIQVRI